MLNESIAISMPFAEDVDWIVGRLVSKNLGFNTSSINRLHVTVMTAFSGSDKPVGRPFTVKLRLF